MVKTKVHKIHNHTREDKYDWIRRAKINQIKKILNTENKKFSEQLENKTVNKLFKEFKSRTRLSIKTIPTKILKYEYYFKIGKKEKYGRCS